MQDHPTPDEMLAVVATFLREQVVTQVTGHTAFQARVAANALELVRRQLQLAEAGEAAELQRLRALLQDPDGTLRALNDRLADAIAADRLDWRSPGVAEHLRATTAEKIRVDQPQYSGIVRGTRD